jgi:two-component system sensor histidine kinase BarA
MRVSVAVKLVFFFGLSIVAVVMAALAVPWAWMQSLADELAVQAARKAALVAYARVGMPDTADWSQKQEQLDKWWPQLGRQTEGAPADAPRLIQIDPASRKPPEEADAFLLSAIDYLRSHPGKREWTREFHSKNGRFYRYVMAVRAPAPIGKGELLGVIEPKVSPAITQEQVWWNRAVILTAGGMSLIVALLLFSVATRNLILRPVKQLRDVADQVAAGDLSVRARMRTRDEFQRLSEATNNMLESLQRSQEELRKINRSLDVKIVELAELNEALNVANRLKSQFVASVSHELRTPLTSIIGFAELLTQAPTDPDSRIQRYAANILSSGRMLLDLINDLLDLAKIEAGKMELHNQDFSLHEVCEGLYDFMKPQADKAGLHFELQVAAGLPRMHSDAGKIKQVLYNLLSNAVKFTQPGGQVALSARQVDERHVQISVSDTGPGISKERQALVFETFRQVDEGRTRQHGGAGLGLAISKELVALLGGQISVDSEVGQGATFTVVLPIEVATTETPAAATAGKPAPLHRDDGSR